MAARKVLRSPRAAWPPDEPKEAWGCRGDGPWGQVAEALPLDPARGAARCRMTELVWLACEDPQQMLDHIHGRASVRKDRLFSAACCRRIWPLLTHKPLREAVLTAERHAD